MIHIQSLRKTYRTGLLQRPRHALKGIDLQVQRGEIFGFIGPNGAGKSTTIKILTGLLRPESGRVSLMGGSPQDPRSRQHMGYLPEQPYFYDYLSGWELLNFYGALCGLRGKVLQQRMEWSLGLVHANQDWIHRRLRTYSKGMLQRVGLAQAILAKPELLILDEPMSGLDPLGRRDIRNAIQSLNQEGTTVFYSSHVLSDVEQISHRVAMIVDGQIVQEGRIAEITPEESAEFQVITERPLLEHPAGVCSGSHACEYRCDNAESRDRLLHFCLENRIGIQKLDRFRPSLEDVLAREVARAES